jgi:hypothetical protein
MSPDPCVCFIRGCQNEAPEGCWLCDACFERYAKDDPRRNPRVNFTISNNQEPERIAREVVSQILAKRRARNMPLPPDAA